MNVFLHCSLRLLECATTLDSMNQFSRAVSIHPYFKIEDGKINDFKEVMNDFVERTKTEEGCFYYDFSICEDQVFCRESYVDAEAVLIHLENVGSCIEAVLKFSDLYRLEIHGPSAELEKLKGPLADLSPDFYSLCV